MANTLRDEISDSMIDVLKLVNGGNVHINELVDIVCYSIEKHIEKQIIHPEPEARGSDIDEGMLAYNAAINDMLRSLE